jgi:hypothetical protein
MQEKSALINEKLARSKVTFIYIQVLRSLLRNKPYTNVPSTTPQVTMRSDKSPSSTRTNMEPGQDPANA